MNWSIYDFDWFSTFTWPYTSDLWVICPDLWTYDCTKDPYFNEPGHESPATSSQRSIGNEDAEWLLDMLAMRDVFVDLKMVTVPIQSVCFLLFVVSFCSWRNVEEFLWRLLKKWFKLCKGATIEDVCYCKKSSLVCWMLLAVYTIQISILISCFTMHVCLTSGPYFTQSPPLPPPHKTILLLATTTTTTTTTTTATATATLNSRDLFLGDAKSEHGRTASALCLWFVVVVGSQQTIQGVLWGRNQANSTNFLCLPHLSTCWLADLTWGGLHDAWLVNKFCLRKNKFGIIDIIRSFNLGLSPEASLFLQIHVNANICC